MGRAQSCREKPGRGEAFLTKSAVNCAFRFEAPSLVAADPPGNPTGTLRGASPLLVLNTPFSIRADFVQPAVVDAEMVGQFMQHHAAHHLS